MATLDNARHERFAQAVASGTGLAEAYIQAGYNVRSRKVAEVSGQALRSKPEVDQRIAELLAAGAKRAEVSAADVIRELMRIAFFNPKTVLRWVDAQTEIYEANPDELEPEDIDALEEEVKAGTVERTQAGYYRKTIIIPAGVSLINSDEVSDDAAAALASVEQTSAGLRVKFHSKVSALEMLGKYLQLWADNTAATGKPFAITDKPLTAEQWLAAFAAKSDGTQH
jgi:phage terminase small subunit